MSQFASILGAIKAIASIVKMVLLGLEQWRDKLLDDKVQERKAERARLIKQLEKAKTTGANDATIKDIHRRLDALK